MWDARDAGDEDLVGLRLHRGEQIGIELVDARHQTDGRDAVAAELVEHVVLDQVDHPGRALRDHDPVEDPSALEIDELGGLGQERQLLGGGAVVQAGADDLFQHP